MAPVAAARDGARSAVRRAARRRGRRRERRRRIPFSAKLRRARPCGVAQRGLGFTAAAGSGSGGGRTGGQWRKETMSKSTGSLELRGENGWLRR